MARDKTSAGRGASKRPINIELTRAALARARDAGWSNRRLARLIDKSDAYAGKLFDGRGALDLGWSLSLAAALGVSLDDLFSPATGVNEPQTPFIDATTSIAEVEAELLAMFRSVPPARQAEALARVRPVLQSFSA